MMEIFEIFSLPFMQRALIAGVISAFVLGWIGIFVVARRMSFFGDGIAHASLAGVALAILIGWAPIPVALVLAVIFGVLIFFLEQKLGLSNDVAIGILFSAGMALGVLLLSFTQGFQPELISFLFGSILSVTNLDLWTIAGIGIVAAIILYITRNKLAFVSFDKEGAYLAGIDPNKYILLLYILTSVSVIISIRLIGIILTSALLILPSATGRLWARSFKEMELFGIIIATFSVIAGLFISVAWNIPSGAAIILTGTAIFILAALGHLLTKK